MKNLKKYVGVLMLLTLLVGFTSCEDDETIFDHIVGRTWQLTTTVLMSR